MVKSNSHKSPDNICFQCGAMLIFVSRETVKLEGSRYPQINVIYKCSNVACQDKKDREKVDREKQQVKKTEMAQIRLEEKQKLKELNKKLDDIN
jgi:hypothetical protein